MSNPCVSLSLAANRIARANQIAGVRLKPKFTVNSLYQFAMCQETSEFLEDLRGKKTASGIDWPSPWDAGEIKWLVVEDNNSTGLKGSLDERTCDFWNYWLNFGISNESGTGRGGARYRKDYPHESLTRDAIIAAAIEHFAPAVISGALVVEVDGHTVTADSIDDESMRVALSFPAGPLRDDPSRFLHLVRLSSQEPMFVISVEDPKDKFISAIDPEVVGQIRAAFDKDDKVNFTIEIPVTQCGQTTKSALLGVVSRSPKGKKPIDLFFREGMCLPEVSARNTADVDSILLSTEGQLSTYLNFCEGKAHLGLIENKEVSAKLKEHGFSGHPAIKRMVKMLPDDLRRLVLPDADKPDASIFSSFFSIPKPADDKKKREGGTGKKDEPSPGPPPGPIPPPQPQAFRIRELEDGFHVDSNPSYTNRPVNLRLSIAYADGSRRPKWSKFDFQLGNLTISHGGSNQPECSGNVIVCRECESDFFLEVSGFDTRRELVTFLGVFHDA